MKKSIFLILGSCMLYMTSLYAQLRTIEAESYSAMSGVQTEPCSEGGLNVGWIDAGDWMAYNGINFPTTGTYRIEYRVASINGGTLSSDLNAGSIVLGQVSIPATGGWQTWTTVSQTVSINAGTYNFGIFAVTGGWNINWIKIYQQTSSSSLLWSDEFNGTSLNTAFWTYEIGGGGWGNNELQYYRDGTANTTVSGGTLKIIAKRESYGGYQYTSARIKTQGKYSVQYGNIQARLRVPMGQGLWPAFWMLGANFSSVGWPACGEIDIMEHVNSENTVHGTIHWNGPSGYASYTGSTSTTPQNWHVYSINWSSNNIRWYVDGVQYHVANIQNNINSTEEFHRPFFFILNLAVGGNWPGAPNASTPFPATYEIDYVRVYSANMSLNEKVETAVSNPETSAEFTVNLYPNPSNSGFVQVKLANRIDNSTKVSLIDMQGRLVWSGTFSNENIQINTSSLAPG
ncbi:MAG: family 16 glycosylhydrolase, partial [Bacteroidales bacterium]|nr:family 16 glycosylhydrolase [Bacteroidales bacterium]